MKKRKKKSLSSIFKELETKNIEELDHYYIPDLLSLDALRVILYKYSLSILFYKERILLHDDDEDLHQFRINIRKSRTFLKEFDFLFPKELHTYFDEYLSTFATMTNQKRDLDVIKDRLEQLNEKHDAIQDNIKQQQVVEQQHIREIMKNHAFNDFFISYQGLLRRDSNFTSDNNKKSIESTAKKVIKKLHFKIINKISDLEEDHHFNKLHKIRISFKRLRYLLEEFQHIFGEKKIEKMIEKGKDLQTLLGDLNDSVNQTKLLHNYFQSDITDSYEGRELEKKLLKKTAKKQQKRMKKSMKKLHMFKEEDFKL